MVRQQMDQIPPRVYYVFLNIGCYCALGMVLKLEHRVSNESIDSKLLWKEQIRQNTYRSGKLVVKNFEKRKLPEFFPSQTRCNDCLFL
jgi:hypothetical protein